MATFERDRTLDTLLELDGQIFFVDEAGTHWVKFDVKRTEPTEERPHGLKYSLTLHDAKGERLVGYDNAHAVRATRRRASRAKQKHDHKHRRKTVEPYEYKDAATLLSDFWSEVDAMLRQRGVLK